MPQKTVLTRWTSGCCVLPPRTSFKIERLLSRVLDNRSQLSVLSANCLLLREVTFPKETHSSCGHDWLMWEYKGLASLPCQETTLRTQYNFKLPMGQLRPWCDCTAGQFLLYPFLLSFVSIQVIFKSTHQLTSCVLMCDLVSVFLETQLLRLDLKVLKESRI